MKKYIVILISFVALTNNTWAQRKNNFPPIRNNAIKINLLSPAYGTLTMGYQHHFTPVKSWQITASIMNYSSSSGFWDAYVKSDNSDDRTQGISLNFEYRYNLTGAGVSGSYISPFVRYHQFERKKEMLNGNNPPTFDFKSNFQSGGFGIMVGHQYLLKDKFTVDFFAGLTYLIMLDKKLTDKNGSTTSDFDQDNYLGLGINNAYLSGYGIRGGVTFGIAY